MKVQGTFSYPHFILILFSVSWFKIHDFWAIIRMAYSLGSGKNIKTDSTGRVTSVELGSGERVGFQEAQKRAYDRAVAGGDPSGGGYRYRTPAINSPMAAQDAAERFGITPETPYGTARPPSAVGGFFQSLANATGGQVNYDLTPRQRQQVMDVAYARATNPFNDPRLPGYASDAGGDLSRGIGREGLKAGEQTARGIATAYRAPMSGPDRIAAGLASALVPGGGLAADRATRVMGVGDVVPEGATPLRGGILDMLTGGQTDFLIDQGSRLLDKVSNKADEIINRGDAVKAGEQQIKGGITGVPTQQAPVEPIPGAFEVSDITSLTNNPQVQGLRRLAEDYLSEDRGFKIRGGAPSGSRYQLNVNPVGPDRGARFDFRMPLQDFGIGNLFSQNMDPRQNFNVTV
jgi:hypothetical protein